MIEAAVGKILFVDNAHDWRQVLGQLLRHVRSDLYSVVHSIEQATAAIATGEYETIVADWHMPDDGLAFMQRIKRAHPGYACIVLTGFKHDIDERVLRELESAGISVYDKDQATPEWLEALADPERRGAASSAQLESMTIDGIQDAPAAIRDVVYAQRLLLEDMKREATTMRESLRMVASDLCDDLRALPEQDVANLIGPGAAMSVEDMMVAIETNTELGRQLLLTDRKIQRRMRGGAL